MRTLPPRDDISEFDALVIRTDYSDDLAWQHLKRALAKFGDAVSDLSHQIVDDPAWAGATVDDVLASVAAAGHDLAVVFVADATTMRSDHHGLLAVTTLTEEEVGEVEYEATIQFGREFRTVPEAVSGIHANLQLANRDFAEFAYDAVKDPAGVNRDT